jgi:N-acetylglucosamine-6-sulfatase
MAVLLALALSSVASLPGAAVSVPSKATSGPQNLHIDAPSKRPNVWFLMADDLDADWKQDHSAIMPSLRKYWKEGGVEFTNHVAAVPVCGPSRSSLLTARYPHNNGYRMNSDSPSIETWCGAHNPSANMNRSVGDWLARSGYYTAFLGKTVNSCEAWANSGWSHWG